MRFFKYSLILAAFSCLLFSAQQSSAQDTSTEWFAANCLFPMLEYDLLEVQPYAGMHVLNAQKQEFEGIYIPVNIGFRKSIIQWDMLSFRFDFALGVASYTQFEIIRYDENTLRGGLLNTDFKASGFLFASKGRSRLRMQLFHISSHLGDDYILRNQDYELNDKSVNYEQLHLTYLLTLKKAEVYLGLGQVITPNTFRKRFMLQAGFQGSFPINPALDFTLGTDIKLYDENDYIPDVHSGIGVTINQREQHQVNFSVDSFFGHLPYSTLDFGKVFWIGDNTRLYL